MPEIFRFNGFSFFFFSREHEPIHVHDEGNNGYAKFTLIKNQFELTETKGIKTSDLTKIKKVIKENSDIIIQYWNNFFAK